MKATIRNFQAHEDLTIELGPTVTSIVGATDAGKSSVLRALWWVMTNQPKGDAFIRNGAKAAEVDLDVDNHTIRRFRSRSQNVYTLDGQEYKAFGNDVPPDIEDLLNVSPLNFQGQHDAPFWFAETAGEVSRQLNQIVDLGTIDSALANIDSVIRKGRATIEVSQERRGALKQEGKALEWTKQAHVDLGNTEALGKAWVRHAADRVRLGLFMDQAEEYETKASTLSEARKCAQEAVKAGEVWEAHYKRAGALERATGALTALISTASQLTPPSLAPLEALGVEMGEAEKRTQRLAILITNLEEGELTICHQESGLSSAKSKLKKAMGNRCPLCGSQIKS